MTTTTNLQQELQAIAQGIKDCTGAMSPVQLDSWYAQKVGYAPSEDDPELLKDHKAHAALVASSMFYHACPEGVDTPFAEAIEAELHDAIVEGRPLLF